MATRRAFLLVGLPDSGSAVIPAAIATHATALAERGLRQPAASEDEMFRAVVEIRRDHRAFGLRRKDVEGVWSAICRRTQREKGDVLVGHDLLAGAGPDEIALLLDALPGFAVHVIVVAGQPDPRVCLFPDEHDLGGVLDRWSSAVRTPERLHVVVADPADPQVAWRAVGRILGLDADLFPLDGVGTPTPHLDVATLRLLVSAAGQLAGPAELADRVTAWSKQVAEAGYDLHGDLTSLRPTEPTGTGSATPAQVASLSTVLAETLTELTRLREHTQDLEARNARLARKRRKLKRRLADVIHA